MNKLREDFRGVNQKVTTRKKVVEFLSEQFGYIPEEDLKFKEMGKKKIYSYKMCGLGGGDVIKDEIYEFINIDSDYGNDISPSASKSLGHDPALKQKPNQNLQMNLRIQHYGTYFARIERDGLRLSIEGSYIVGPGAGKGIIEIDEHSAELWMKGEDITSEAEVTGYVIIKHGGYYLGCGKGNGNVIRNFIPKGRRI